MKKTFLLAWFCFLSTTHLFSQGKGHESSLLWRVLDNGLTKPTYLFGTYHFLTNAFVDTLPAVKQAYKASQVVVGEVVIDSSLQAPMIASMLKGTTLKKELPEGLYTKTAKWFNQEAGIDLSKLDQLIPLFVMIFAMAITQQKYYPTKAEQIQLDTYFQQMAKRL
jgi:uncharacterized protein YbaP (TraB family)